MATEYYSLSLKFIIYACVFLSKYAEKIIYNSYAGQVYHNKIGFSQKSGKVIYNGVDSKKFNSTTSKSPVSKRNNTNERKKNAANYIQNIWKKYKYNRRCIFISK